MSASATEPAKPGQHLAALERAHLGGLRLHHGVADADLAVAAEGDAAVLADGQDGGAVEYVSHVVLALTPCGCAWLYTFFSRSTLVWV